MIIAFREYDTDFLSPPLKKSTKDKFTTNIGGFTVVSPKKQMETYRDNHEWYITVNTDCSLI